MISQKSLSHSSLMRSVAPPRRERDALLEPLPLVLRLGLGVRASSLDGVIAARGGLDGGDGRPEIGTSGIPLGPCGTCYCQQAVVTQFPCLNGRLGEGDSLFLPAARVVQ